MSRLEGQRLVSDCYSSDEKPHRVACLKFSAILESLEATVDPTDSNAVFAALQTLSRGGTSGRSAWTDTNVVRDVVSAELPCGTNGLEAAMRARALRPKSNFVVGIDAIAVFLAGTGFSPPANAERRTIAESHSTLWNDERWGDPKDWDLSTEAEFLGLTFRWLATIVQAANEVAARLGYDRRRLGRLTLRAVTDDVTAEVCVDLVRGVDLPPTDDQVERAGDRVRVHDALLAGVQAGLTTITTLSSRGDLSENDKEHLAALERVQGVVTKRVANWWWFASAGGPVTALSTRVWYSAAADSIRQLPADDRRRVTDLLNGHFRTLFTDIKWGPTKDAISAKREREKHGDLKLNAESRRSDGKPLPPLQDKLPQPEQIDDGPGRSIRVTIEDPTARAVFGAFELVQACGQNEETWFAEHVVSPNGDDVYTKVYSVLFPAYDAHYRSQGLVGVNNRQQRVSSLREKTLHSRGGR